MRKKILFLLITAQLYGFSAYSQRGARGTGVYFGYGFAKYTPGLGNISSTTYLYNQKYGADFNFKNRLSGPAIGIRTIKGLYQMDLEWLFRYSKVESSYTDATTNSEWKLGIKTRYNTWFWGHALRVKNFAIGAGVDIGKFKLFTRQAPIGEYNGTKWSRETIYGSKIALSKMLDITGGWIFYADYMPKYFGIRVYYAIPMGSESFSNDASLSFYEFYPRNMGISFFINLSKIE